MATSARAQMTASGACQSYSALEAVLVSLDNVPKVFLLHQIRLGKYNESAKTFRISCTGKCRCFVSRWVLVSLAYAHDDGLWVCHTRQR